MTDELVHLERRDDGVAVLTLDNPKVNSLSGALLEQLAERAAVLAADPPGAVVLTGGPKIFAAGADIDEFEDADQARAVSDRFRAALGGLEAIPRVTIASVSGYALGGGCELTLGCDFRIAADRARFGQPEILLGIIPGGGGTQRLARLVGPARAKDMILTGRQVKADEALAMGLVDEVVPDDDLWNRTLARAAEFAAGPLVAHGLAKRAIDDGRLLDTEAGLDLERELFAQAFDTDDARIGIESFREHGPGKAGFTGR